MVIITVQRFNDFMVSFYKERIKGYRLGQAFCNTFDITDSVLFYEEDDEVAIEYIYQHHVKVKGDYSEH